jgi:hypothetical protein
MRQGGVQDFGDLTPNVAIEVRPGNNSQFVSQDNFPTTMVRGTSRQVTVRFRNTGVYTWTSGAYSLCSVNPFGNRIWGPITVQLPAGASIAPQSEAVFTFNITAPNQLGTYNCQWQMRRSGQENFGPFSTNVAIQVTN